MGLTDFLVMGSPISPLARVLRAALDTIVRRCWRPDVSWGCASSLLTERVGARGLGSTAKLLVMELLLWYYVSIRTCARVWQLIKSAHARPPLHATSASPFRLTFEPLHVLSQVRRFCDTSQGFRLQPSDHRDVSARGRHSPAFPSPLVRRLAMASQCEGDPLLITTVSCRTISQA